MRFGEYICMGMSENLKWRKNFSNYFLRIFAQNILYYICRGRDILFSFFFQSSIFFLNISRPYLHCNFTYEGLLIRRGKLL